MDYLQATLKHFGKEKECTICGKAFLGGEDWAYQRRKREHGRALYFCSWTCMRNFDAGHTAKKGRKRTPHEKEIYRRLDVGERPIDIARDLGITIGTVHYYKDRWTEQREDAE